MAKNQPVTSAQLDERIASDRLACEQARVEWESLAVDAKSERDFTKLAMLQAAQHLFDWRVSRLTRDRHATRTAEVNALIGESVSTLDSIMQRWDAADRALKDARATLKELEALQWRYAGGTAVPVSDPVLSDSIRKQRTAISDAEDLFFACEIERANEQAKLDQHRSELFALQRQARELNAG